VKIPSLTAFALAWLVLVPTASLAQQECSDLAVSVATTPAPSAVPDALQAASNVLATMPEKADLVLLGDSLLELWRERIYEDFPGVALWNYSVGGDRVQQLLWRLDKPQLQNITTDKVLILIGTNNLFDRGTAGCSVFAGVQLAIAKARALWPAADIFILTVPPRGGEFHSADPIRLELNRLIMQRAATDPKIHPIQIDDNRFTCGIYDDRARAPAPLDRCLAPNQSICENYMPDDTHFSRQGYLTLRSMLAEYSLATFGHDVFAGN